MFQNEETMASNDENFPETKAKKHISNGEKDRCLRENYHDITLLYSHRKPDNGIAMSCNGHCITFSIKALILGG